MTVTAASQGYLLCDGCYRLNHAGPEVLEPTCARCGTALHARKPASLACTWAYLLAAAILYIPANLLPVMDSAKLTILQSDTIWSGAVYLWNEGNRMLSAIVFIASIVIPAVKIVSLGWLLIAAQMRSTHNPLRRAKLYRATAYIGRWSMVDIFVGAVLVGLVQFGAFAYVLPGPGAIFFAAVVVLTMLASASFDPRLTWDPLQEEQARER
jgi:paraquat-inducible protein A